MNKSMMIDKIPNYDPSNISNCLLKSNLTKIKSPAQSPSNKIADDPTKKKTFGQKSYSLIKKNKENQQNQLKHMRTATSQKVKKNLLNKYRDISTDINIVTVNTTNKQEVSLGSLNRDSKIKSNGKSLGNFRNRV